MNAEISTRNQFPRSFGKEVEEKVETSTIKAKSRRVNRTCSAKEKKIDFPRDVDVLCGRGRGYFEHPGNRRMLAIISKYKPEYQMASKIEKSAITQRVLNLVLNPQDGSARPRFLKKETGKKKGGISSGWSELCVKEVHKKVAHTLREQKTIVKMANLSSDECLQQLDECSSTTSAIVIEEEWIKENEEDESIYQPFSSVNTTIPATDLARWISSEVCDSHSEETVTRKASYQTGLFENPIVEGTILPQVKTTSSGTIVTLDANPVSDDEASSSHDYWEVSGTQCHQQEEEQCGRYNRRVSVRRSVIPWDAAIDEPLGFDQEPIFDERDIDNFLNTALEDVGNQEDTLLDSFLDDFVVSL